MIEDQNNPSDNNGCLWLVVIVIFIYAFLQALKN